jgi:nucleoid-associated protein YgaU
VEGDPIVRGAHDAGEELVTLDGRPVSGNAITPPTKPNKATAKAAKQYEAASGDTLSKMAQKFYGSSSKAYRDAIVAANPSLKGDPNKIMAGETYVIPAIDNGGSTQAAPAPRNEPKAAAKEKSPSLETYYTVKAGDSLWAIARDQCGDPGAVAAIQELNKDSLKGSTSVRIGMKLKLPNKPVASAN